MKITLDGMITVYQPEAITWEPPQVIARDGDYAPIRGQFFSCRLAFGRIAEPHLQDWHAAFDTDAHTVILPHPYTGTMTSYSCYVDSVTPRMDTSDQSDHCAALSGFDVTLTGILVT